MPFSLLKTWKPVILNVLEFTLTFVPKIRPVPSYTNLGIPSGISIVPHILAKWLWPSFQFLSF